MFGPGLRRNLGTRRRSRRLVIALVVAALVVVLVLVEIGLDVARSGSSARRRAARSWASAATAIVDQSNTLPLLFLAGESPSERACERAGGCDLAAEASFDNAASQAAAQKTELDVLGLAPPSARAGALLTLVLAGRVEGATDLRSAARRVLFPSSDPSGTAATSLVANARSAIERSDANYVALRRLVRDGNPSLHLPASAWSKRAGLKDGAESQIVNRLSALRSDQHGSSLEIVALALEPAPERIIGLSTTTTTTTTSITTTTGTSPVTSSSLGTTSITTASSAPGAGRAITTTTVTTTTIAPAEREQIPSPEAISVLAPTRHLSVLVTVRAGTGASLTDVALSATLEVTKGAHTGALPGLRARLGSLAASSAKFAELRRFDIPKGSEQLRLTVRASAARLNAVSDVLELKFAS